MEPRDGGEIRAARSGPVLAGEERYPSAGRQRALIEGTSGEEALLVMPSGAV